MVEAPSSVCALFFKRDLWEVLAVSRKGNLEDLGLPGGKIEPAEPPMQAIIREVREEVGVELVTFERCYERVDPVDGNVAWCYRVTRWRGEPRAMEPRSAVLWVPPERFLERNCTFREYNRGLLLHEGLISHDLF